MQKKSLRRCRKAPVQHETTKVQAIQPAPTQRQEPDDSDRAITDAEDPTTTEDGTLFRPRLRFVPEK